jgi:hyperosmotically inducible protein
MNNLKNTIYGGIALCAMLALTNCNTYGHTNKSHKHSHKPVNEKQETMESSNMMSDSAITAKIKSKYLADSEIKGMKVHVSTTNGEVKLTGQVSNNEMKEKAISTAKDTDGVKNVISELKTKP